MVDLPVANSQPLPPPPPPTAELENRPVEQGGKPFYNRIVQEVIVYVVMVLFLAMMGIGITVGIEIANTNRTSEATYSDLVNQVQKQNFELELIAQKLGVKIPQGI